MTDLLLVSLCLTQCIGRSYMRTRDRRMRLESESCCATFTCSCRPRHEVRALHQLHCHEYMYTRIIPHHERHTHMCSAPSSRQETCFRLVCVLHRDLAFVIVARHPSSSLRKRVPSAREQVAPVVTREPDCLLDSFPGARQRKHRESSTSLR